MYYYPYFLHFIYLLSFTHHNSLDKNDMIDVSNKTTDLWSISLWSYTRYKGSKPFTASYNHYTQNYEFAGKRYISYDDLVNDALNGSSF